MNKAVCMNIVLEKLKENGETFSDSGLSRVQQELILNEGDVSIDGRQSLTVITITAVCWAVRVIISAKTLWQAPAHSSCYLFSTIRSPGASEGTCTEIINLRAVNHSHFHPSAQVVQMNPAGYFALFGSQRPNKAQKEVWPISDPAFHDRKT